MSDAEGNNAAKSNSAESLDTCNGDEKTMIEHPSTAELREEILKLKESLKVKPTQVQHMLRLIQLLHRPKRTFTCTQRPLP